MAGTIGALKFSLCLPLYKPRLPSCFLRLAPFSTQISLPLHLRLHSLAMAQPEDQTNNGNDTEVQEPSPKIQKLERDVLAETDEPLLLVQKLSDKAVLPFRASSLAAGYDLTSSRNTTVPARGMARVSTDLIIGLPEGTYGRVAPRSGLASRYSIDVGAGVIDADYRGPLGVILFNHSDKDFEIKIGDRIAQLIIEKIMTPEVEVVEDLNLDFTERGDGGFGSTGII